jgi:hypothetical protein
VLNEERFLSRGADLPGTDVLHVGLGEIAGPLAHGNHLILASLAIHDERLAAFDSKVAE